MLQPDATIFSNIPTQQPQPKRNGQQSQWMRANILNALEQEVRFWSHLAIKVIIQQFFYWGCYLLRLPQLNGH
jgi:hypothetical protein